MQSYSPKIHKFIVNSFFLCYLPVSANNYIFGIEIGIILADRWIL